MYYNNDNNSPYNFEDIKKYSNSIMWNAVNEIARKNALIFLYQYKTNRSTIILNNFEYDYYEFNTEFFSELRKSLEIKKERLINVYNSNEAILNSYLTSIYKNVCNITINKLQKEQDLNK